MVAKKHAHGAHAPLQCFRPDPHAPRVWARGGLFSLRPPPPMSSGVDRFSRPLGFPVWYLDLLLLVFFVFDSSLYLGFLRGFFKFLTSKGTLWP